MISKESILIISMKAHIGVIRDVGLLNYSKTNEWDDFKKNHRQTYTEDWSVSEKMKYQRDIQFNGSVVPGIEWKIY